MPIQKKLRILCYDISCDRRRRRVARLLEEEATRVQYSVFETRLNMLNLNKLLDKIRPILDGTDSLRVYTVGKTGERECFTEGSGIPIDDDGGYWLL